jgi:predicted  nucleic acid-binding Zn-ribbon protein
MTLIEELQKKKENRAHMIADGERVLAQSLERVEANEKWLRELRQDLADLDTAIEALEKKT